MRHSRYDFRPIDDQLSYNRGTDVNETGSKFYHIDIKMKSDLKELQGQRLGARHESADQEKEGRHGNTGAVVPLWLCHPQEDLVDE